VTVLDRKTGAPRGAAEGLDGSVAVMSTGPDGAYYIGSSPLRRAFAVCVDRLAPGMFPDPVQPLVGGITKYAPVRRDLLARDAACAAADRARNAASTSLVCPSSARSDATQILELLEQARGAAFGAVKSGELDVRAWLRVDRRIASELAALRPAAVRWIGPKRLGQRLDRSARGIERVCRQLDPDADPAGPE
jgi:hypothetical protein